MSIQSNFPAIAPSLLLDFANTKQLDNRITFTRSTPAVYYDGKTTAMAEQNTVLYSQDIANGYWTKYQVSLSSATAPDGTSTASTLTEAITDNNHAIWTTAGPIVTTTDISSTFSIYAKAGTCSTFAIQIYRTGVGFFIDFDLTTVASNIRSGTGTSSITAVGGGWYRCTVTSSSLGSNTWQFEVYMTLTYGGSSAYLGTGRTLSLWGVQAEQRNAVTAYTVTTTQPITNYIPVLLSAGGNQARFDCNPTTGESLGLLIEEARTNIFPYSSEFNNAPWDKNAYVTVSANQTIAPDGTLTADKIIAGTTSFYQLVYQTIATSVQSYTLSVYAKAGEYAYLQILDDTSGLNFSSFNLATGAIVTLAAGHSASIISVGNGWYRCSVSFTGFSSGARSMYFGGAPDGTNQQFAGNGFNGIYIWGSQFEAGSFATSYIATTSASATRTADAASMTGTNFSSWYNQAEGTLYSEATYLATVQQSSIYIGDGGTSNAIWVGRNVAGTGANNAEAYIRANSANQGFPLVASGITVGTSPVKMSLAYKVNDMAFSANGSTVATDTVGVIPLVNQMLIGQYIYTNDRFMTIKKIAYYPIAVTQTNLQALTS